MDAWRRAFAHDNVPVAQILLSPYDFAQRRQYLHARSTMEALTTLGAVAIVNENDAVADEEIRFGDNDRIAALVANMVGATDLVLLTDTPGLLTADPRLDPTATLIEEIRAVDHEVSALAGVSRSASGAGVWPPKLRPRASRRGPVWRRRLRLRESPVPCRRPSGAARGPGPTFAPTRSASRPARPGIAFAATSAGQIQLNDGAVAAIAAQGRSLLAVGVTDVTGAFDEGEAVDLVAPNGDVVAKGLARVSAEEWRSAEGTLVHRDDLVVLVHP
jgi:glutamate 5-kinase